MVYRATYKGRTREELVLKRFALTTRQTLRLNYELCVGCKICEKVCPEGAVSEATPPLIVDGRLVRRGRVDINADKCTFCGECVVLCPLNAIKIEINNEEKIPVVENNAFPNLIKGISINTNLCSIECKLACEEKCPRKAIKVILSNDRTKILNVLVDKQLCIYCKICQAACPKEAITVIKPMSGVIEIDTSLCPEGCQVCADACPSKCIALGADKKPVINKEYCIFCGACVEVCPKKAIGMRRTTILHTDVKSGAWNEALEKLASREALIKEINVKRGKKVSTLASSFIPRSSPPI